MNDHSPANGSSAVDLSIFDDTHRITRAFDEAVRDALLEHKRLGNPVAIWRDGKVVILPPEEIPESGLDEEVAQEPKGRE